MLRNKCAVITGASRGLGEAIAREFVAQGACVFLCARNAADLEKVCEALRRERREPEQAVFSFAGDLAEESTAEEMIRQALARMGRIDILVNNAAVQGPIGPMEKNPWEQWKRTLATDLLTPAHLIHEVLPLMKKQDGGKIVNLSGGGATGPRENYSAYAVAKTGLVRLTETIARETRDDHIGINAIAPGAMNGRMLEETLQAGEDAVGKAEYAKALERKEKGGVPPETAARLCAFLASPESDGITGRLISAVWDDWEHFTPERVEKMRNGDIYTLRRIIPQDRGDNWDKPGR